MGWVWELFWRFLRFQLLFSYFFRLMGWILGAVLKVLWIIAPQDLPTMLSTYGYCTLCYANRAIIRYKGIGYASQIWPGTGSKTQSWLRLCRKIKDNPRFITAPFRETKAFEKLYNQRTSVERTFGDLKDNYNLDNIRVAKMARAKVFMDLSCIALIASRLSDAASKEKTTKIVQIYHYKNSELKRAILNKNQLN